MAIGVIGFLWFTFRAFEAFAWRSAADALNYGQTPQHPLALNLALALGCAILFALSLKEYFRQPK